MKSFFAVILFLGMSVNAHAAAMWDSLNGKCYTVTYTAGCGGPPGCATTTVLSANTQTACAALNNSAAATNFNTGTGNTVKPLVGTKR